MPFTFNLIVPPSVVAAPLAPSVFAGHGQRARPDWGYDIAVFPSLDASFTPRNDHVILADSFARRMFTPRGRLWAHPNYGFDVRDYLNDTITVNELEEIRASVDGQAEQDERILACATRVSFDPNTGLLGIRTALDTAAGPFSMVFSITELTADVFLEA